MAVAADSDHKLCGFLAAVVTTSVPPPYSAATDLPRILPLNTPCHVFKNGPDVGFESADGVILSLIKSSEEEKVSSNAADGIGGGGGGASSSAKKRGSRFGLVHGGVSVVHQLHNLVAKKCVKITARVIRIAVRDCGEVRVVVLVDVYLPVEVWSGWQFPRSRSTAAALFRHLSCDWKARSIMLEFENPDHAHDDSVWNISGCHVLGCNQHRNAPDASKIKMFELHEIFKSLPTALKQRKSDSSGVHPEDSGAPGFWVLPDDVLMSILTLLGPLDLHRLSSTCQHLRFLAATVMPCMKLKLYPHQQAAVEWMLKREQEPEVLPNPLYLNFVTEDGFSFNMNTVTGEVVTGTVPTIRDFRGGMFCDEPGLGKTITALSLILKTQGTLADPPEGVEINWCKHNGDQKCGYYELSSDSFNCGSVLSKKNSAGRSQRRGLLSLETISPKVDIKWASLEEVKTSVDSTPATSSVWCTRSWTNIKRNLLHAYKEPSDLPSDIQVRGNSRKRKHASAGTRRSSQETKGDSSCKSQYSVAKEQRRPLKISLYLMKLGFNVILAANGGGW